MSDYKAAYLILMEYWDSLPKKEQPKIAKRLDKVLNVSHNPPKNAIKNALKRLKDKYGFGVK